MPIQSPSAGPGRDPVPHRFAPPVMSLTMRRLGTDAQRTRLITVCGELDRGNAHLLVELVELATGQQPTWVLLDLSRVVVCGAHAVTALLRANDAVVRTGGALSIGDAASCVRTALSATGADRQLHLVGPPAPAAPRRSGGVSTGADDLPELARTGARPAAVLR